MVIAVVLAVASYAPISMRTTLVATKVSLIATEVVLVAARVLEQFPD